MAEQFSVPFRPRMRPTFTPLAPNLTKGTFHTAGRPQMQPMQQMQPMRQMQPMQPMQPMHRPMNVARPMHHVRSPQQNAIQTGIVTSALPRGRPKFVPLAPNMFEKQSTPNMFEKHSMPNLNMVHSRPIMVQSRPLFVPLAPNMTRTNHVPRARPPQDDAGSARDRSRSPNRFEKGGSDDGNDYC
eukprot:GEMP01067166.1.p1 GENE.GEMP01067166.1~~GEMP01067166.1.p1  ORF type:complete len:185 (+),score=52.01 GEMP01067166.1:181-735(+)